MNDYEAWLNNTTNETTASIERSAGGDVWMCLAAGRVRVAVTKDRKWAEILVNRELIDLQSEALTDLQTLRTLLNDPRLAVLLDAAPPA